MTESESFDFVIVGAGSAGCVLANRLSADTSVRVALVEAGAEDSSPWIHIPAGTREVVGNPRFDWCFTTEEEPVLKRSGPVFRGKVLGGSSSINGTVYTRGVPDDYNQWRQLGLSGWSWDDVQPYFREIERFSDGGDEVRGGEGELRIEQPRIRMKIFDVLDAAAREAGMKPADSFNRGQNEGFGMFDVTQHRGRRWSSAKAFLKGARKRRNLTVFTDAHCNRILFKDRQAVGVELHRHHQLVKLSVRREVILTAGAIGTPQILQLSGVGDPDALRSLGIEVVHPSRAVGLNLQDHLSMRMAYRVSGIETVNTRYHNLAKRALMGMEYAALGSGPLVMGAPLWGGFIRSSPNLDRPNLQFLAMPITVTAATSFSKPDDFDGVSCGVYNMHPRSRGRVVAKSRDPREAPSILHNYLSDPHDRQVALDSIRVMRRLFSQPSFQALKPVELRPGLHAQSDEALFEAAAAQCGTAYHQVGTCAMGPEDDAPLDDQLRVRGIGGLRVADGSALPALISGNTNACIMMIAARAAALVRANTSRQPTISATGMS